MTSSDPTTASPAALLHTPLHALHLELGAKMVPFAGYAMPVSYPQGILAEHRQCRESAVLFDVSHMGQLRLTGDDAAAALETLVPVDIVGLGVGTKVVEPGAIVALDGTGGTLVVDPYDKRNLDTLRHLRRANETTTKATKIHSRIPSPEFRLL